MSSSPNKASALLPRPTSDDRGAWRSYWNAVDEPWRTEPEISPERQWFLSEHRSTIVNVRQGQYPFARVELTRADVEWLLSTHDNYQGPVMLQRKRERARQGLDLRGAYLRGVDLVGLPLARLRAGFDGEASFIATSDLREVAAAHMQGAYLSSARLDEANLTGAYLDGATLIKAELHRAILREAHLDYALLSRAHARNADLSNASLRGAQLERAEFDDAILAGADLTSAQVRLARFIRADLAGAIVEDVDLSEAILKETRGIPPSSGEESVKTFEGMSVAQRELAARALTIRLTESSLPAQELARLLTTLTELHTKCWIIWNKGSDGRTLKQYSNTGDDTYEDAANLVIGRISYNSPLLLVVLAASIPIAGALAYALRTYAQLRLERGLAQLKHDNIEWAWNMANKMVDELDPNLTGAEKQTAVTAQFQTLLKLANIDGDLHVLPVGNEFAAPLLKGKRG